MKKLIPLIILLISCLVFSSCQLDFSSQLDDLSNQIFDMAQNLGSVYLQETTSTIPPESSEESSDESSSSLPSGDEVSSGESSSGESPDEPDEPGEPNEPEPPKPSRVIPTVDMILSARLNFAPEKNGAGALAVNNPFGAYRVGGDFDKISLSVEGEYIRIARGYHGINPSLFVNVSLEHVAESDDVAESGDITYSELAEIAMNAQNTFGDTEKVLNLEFGNHPDKYMDTYSYATLLSTIYDGHLGTRPGVGLSLSQYASNTRLMTGNLSKPDFWFVYYLLSDLSDARGGFETESIIKGINMDAFVESSKTPEEHYGDPQNDLIKIANLRNSPANKYIELRISNFGYNTINTSSPYYASEQVQANFLVRSYLLFAELGIDSASIPLYKDVEGSEYNGFGTLRADGTPKTSHYYLSVMRKVLDGFTFETEAVNDKGIKFYIFSNESGDKVYALWSPTNDGTVLENIQIVSDGKHATLTKLTESYRLENEVVTPNTSGYWAVDVAETPVFLTIRADQEAEIEPLIPAREIMTIRDIMGVYVNFNLEKNNTNDLAKHSPFGYAVVGGNPATMEGSVEGLIITSAKSFYRMSPSLYLNYDLSKVVETNEDNVSGVQTFEQVAKKVRSLQNTFGNQMVAGVYRIELGSAPDLHMSAKDYALLLSYCYDGHKGTVASAGIMSASATYAKLARLYTGNLSAPSSTYMNDVLEGLKEARGHQNVVAINGFNTDAFISSASAPESYYLDENNELVKMISLRNESYAHLEINVARFGYTTTDTESEFYASEQMQADYLVRTYLLFAGLGVDHATLAQYKDIGEGEDDGFGTLNADGSEKLAQYYLATMSSTLDGLKFVEAVENEYGVLIYKFASAEKTVYAVWNGVNDGSTVENVEIDIDASGASLIKLGNSYSATKTALSVTDSSISVTAGETPVFVVVE